MNQFLRVTFDAYKSCKDLQTRDRVDHATGGQVEAKGSMTKSLTAVWYLRRRKHWNRITSQNMESVARPKIQDGHYQTIILTFTSLQKCHKLGCV